MQQKPRTRPDYLAAVTLAQELLGIDPKSPTLIEYAGGLLLSSLLNEDEERAEHVVVPQNLGGLPDRDTAWDRMRELCSENPGTVVVVHYVGGSVTGQIGPVRPESGAYAKPAPGMHRPKYGAPPQPC